MPRSASGFTVPGADPEPVDAPAPAPVAASVAAAVGGEEWQQTGAALAPAGDVFSMGCKPPRSNSRSTTIWASSEPPVTETIACVAQA